MLKGPGKSLRFWNSRWRMFEIAWFNCINRKGKYKKLHSFEVICKILASVIWETPKIISCRGNHIYRYLWPFKFGKCSNENTRRRVILAQYSKNCTRVLCWMLWWESLKDLLQISFLQCFWTDWQKLFSNFCPVVALSDFCPNVLCDQDRSY